ncbi:MAG: hypothetical protein QN142_04405 [Armatimonadota bacterium]|nr:hypothetical protein [Armatimonadota bacterium]MDR7388979.1 hypothetical protein [Armatimonadota bacterium]MDR7395839.1 hypothetical protein [Armatimonadota bacterium]MDR7398471.1 hypothetical protein [Armatimonadota bacterium]MDR7407963.1 hypothetical protein [Armatimonadota bacterium]
MNRNLLIGGGLGCGCLTLLAVVAVVAALVVFARPKPSPAPTPAAAPAQPGSQPTGPVSQPAPPAPAPAQPSTPAQPSAPGPQAGPCPQTPPRGPEDLGKGICPQQVPGVEVEGGMAVRLGPDGKPTEPAGTFRVGEPVGILFGVRRMETQVVTLVVKIESQERVVPVTNPQPVEKPGRTLYTLDTQGGSSGLYGFVLAVPQGGQPAVVLLVPFALQ